MTTPHVTPHAVARAAERYGVKLAADTAAALAGRIAARRSLLVRRNKDGSERHLVDHAGLAMLAVWDPVKAAVITFLPRDPRRRRP